MSFDSTFDYSGVVNGVTNDLNTYSAQISDLNVQIASIQSATAYSTVAAVVNYISTLTNQAAFYQNRVAQINELLTEITSIQGQTAEIKTTLYYFYTVLSTTGVSLMDFMSKLPFNLTALNDPIIQQLVADTTTPNDVRVSVAKALYGNYNVNVRVAFALCYFPKQ